MKQVNEELDPLHRLILAYAKPVDRPRYALLFAFDSRCGEIIRSTSEPLIGQMRLTWWRDILTKPAADRPIGEPLVELINEAEAKGVDIGQLAMLLDGWEVLLEDFPWDDRQFDQYSLGRGVSFFGFAVSGRPNGLTESETVHAQSWAMWDFARHCSDQSMRALAFAKLAAMRNQLGDAHFDRTGRPLSIFCKLVARDVQKERLSVDLYKPRTAAMIIWHGITGL